MPRFRTVLAAVSAVLMPAVAVPAAAQEWNDARTMALVTRATERRARQLADTGLTDYTATALGSLTFLAQVGEGFPDPPKVVKADQIALEVYWRAPNSSKQYILGRRDTLLLPTDIQYHRDHLGIVQNNFPSIIRLGEGDEVRDVPHPLSAAGQAAYDYAISDSLRITIPGRTIDVVEVRVRPRDDTRPAAVGAVYLSRDDAQVVRMAFSFTRAALIDQQLEDVAIVLDNALIEERFWLPRRQDIEIRRSGSWLDFPARGIIRGGWEICCYRINQGHPAGLFTGPEIQLAPPERRAVFQFEGPVRSIVPPDLATVTGEDVARVQAQAREIVGSRALAAARRDALRAGSVSDLVRVNRVEGLSLGAGLRRRIAPDLQLAAQARYGVASRDLLGSLQASWDRGTGPVIHLRAYRSLMDASVVPEASGVRNSIGAQEFGADFTAPFQARGVELRLDRLITAGRGITLGLGVARERTDSTPAVATSAAGAWAAPTLSVPSEIAWRVDLRWQIAPRTMASGVLEAWLAYRLRRADEFDRTTGRATAHASWQRPTGAGRLVLETVAGATSSDAPQDRIFAGGPVTGPGYRFHQIQGSALLSQRVEWRFPVPFPTFSLGRWGRTPGEARLAPFTSVIVRRSAESGRIDGFPAIGVGLIAFYDLVRLDLARGLRGGRWRVGIDLTRDLWRIL
jgi:hypothetical protein